MFSDYLNEIGLKELVKKTKYFKLNNFVTESFLQTKKNFSDQEIKKLYLYDIPKFSPDGSCSIVEEKNHEPYNLAITYGLSSPNNSFKKLEINPHTLRLWRLKSVIQKLFNKTKVNWLGAYRKLINPKGEIVLVKESYLGIFSRPEFPLTQDFAKKSNNSTVGLKGKAIVIQDIEKHTGAYYKCDGKVQSEFCLPILNLKKEVIGIIDAESFQKNFFSQELLLQISKVAYDLGKTNLGI